MLGINLIYTDGIYVITVGYTTHMQNLSFKFKFELCVMYLMVKVYTLSVYRRLIHVLVFRTLLKFYKLKLNFKTSMSIESLNEANPLKVCNLFTCCYALCKIFFNLVK